MKLQGKLIATNLAAVIIALVAALAVSIFQLNWLAENDYKTIARNAAQSGESTIEAIASRMTAYAGMLGRRTDIAEALVMGDRAALQDIIVTEFKALSGIDSTLSTLEVTVRNGVVLVRGHHPDKWGDNKQEHPMVMAAIAGNSITSFTVSPTTGEMAQDAIVPVMLGDKLVGTLKAGSYLRKETAEFIKHSTGAEIMFLVNGKLNATTVEAKDFTPSPSLVGASALTIDTVSFGGKSYTAAAIPLKDNSGKAVAVLVTLVDRSALIAAETNAAISLIVAAVIVITLFVIVQVGLTRKLVAPIVSMRDTMNGIAEGAADMTHRIAIQTKDEIGEIGDAFNRMMAELQGVIKNVQDSALQIASASEELSVITDQSSQSMNRQQGETEQVATAVNEMTATAQEVARSAQNAAEGARIANENAESGRQLVSINMDAINELAKGMQRSVDVIRQLDEDSRTIGSVLDVIRGIAEQTNLLALNAAIEAARAGEQGRGFAVVADEVRTLATRTQQSTEEIHTMIERLQRGAAQAVEVITHEQEEVTGSVELAARVGTSLESILEAVRQISDMNSQIASAAEEQSAVAAEVDRTIINISQAGQETADATAQTAQASQSLAELAARLKGLVDHFKT